MPNPTRHPDDLCAGNAEKGHTARAFGNCSNCATPSTPVTQIPGDPFQRPLRVQVSVPLVSHGSFPSNSVANPDTPNDQITRRQPHPVPEPQHLARPGRCSFFSYGLVVLATFRDYGLNGDEYLHIKYGEDILSWYQSGFQDQELFQPTNTWLYGGAFDLIAALIGRVLPLETYDARHLCSALLGLLGIVAAYRLGTLLGGSSTGVLAALFLWLTPRYYGHTFNNPNDIPFAVFYLWGIYYLARGLEKRPQLPRHLIWKIGLAIGLAMGVRVGGLVLLAYMVLFYLPQDPDTPQVQKTPANRSTRQMVLQFLFIGAIAYGTMLIFWPWAQLHPATGPIKALKLFSQFPEIHLNFFEGRYIESTEIPWHYVPKWVLLTLPEGVLFGLVMALLCVFHPGLRSRQVSTASQRQYKLVALSAIFPIVYVALTQMPLYNGPRHILFTVPPLVVLGAAGIGHAWRQFSGGWRRWGLAAFTAIWVVFTLWETIRLHPNQVLYFNTWIAGGLDRAFVHYRTDPQENSYKEALAWVETQYPKPADRKLRISGLGPVYRPSALSLHYAFVDLPEQADVHLSTIWEDRHKLIPGEILHIIRIGRTDLLYILRPDGQYANDPFFTQSPYKYLFLGDFYASRNDRETAIAAYSQAIHQNVHKIITQSRMAQLYLDLSRALHKTGRIPEAMAARQKALALDPNSLETQRDLETHRQPFKSLAK